MTSNYPSSVPRSGGNVGGNYRCEASDQIGTVTASANVNIYTKPIITTGLPTSEVKKSSGKLLHSRQFYHGVLLL